MKLAPSKNNLNDFEKGTRHIKDERFGQTPTVCWLTNHRGHLWIICSSLNVCGCVSLFAYLFHRNDSTVWSERTCLGQTSQRHMAGLEKTAKRQKTQGKKMNEESELEKKSKKKNESMHFTLLHSWVIHTSLYSTWFSCLGATKHKDMQHYSAGLCGALDLKQKQGYIIARQQVKRLVINSQTPTLCHWDDRQVMARLHVCATLSQGMSSLRQKVTSVAAAQLTSVKNDQDLNPSL